MLTFKKWIKAVVATRIREHGCTAKDAKYGLTYSDYWSRYVVKSMDSGKNLTPSVCRSIAKNHPYPILAWIDKNYEGQLPSVYYDTGKVCKDGVSEIHEPDRKYDSKELFL